MDSSNLKVADQTWIATALLHREQPSRPGFRIAEIVDRAAQEGLHRPLRPGVQVHATLHCVAGRRPNGGHRHYRMLSETDGGLRRLFRAGDPVHPYRSGKMIPQREDIPEVYLIDWYLSEYNPGALDGEQ